MKQFSVQEHERSIFDDISGSKMDILFCCAHFENVRISRAKSNIYLRKKFAQVSASHAVMIQGRKKMELPLEVPAFILKLTQLVGLF